MNPIDTFVREGSALMRHLADRHGYSADILAANDPWELHVETHLEQGDEA